MNAIELLKTDHETVSGLFKSFEAAKKSESEDEKQQIVARICEELEAHAAVEEELFYPAVESRAQEDEKAEESVKEAHEEHALVKGLVAELSGMSGDDGQFEAKVKVLKDLVEHHVEEEEGTMMPRARKLLSSEELEELGARLERRKEELRSDTARSGSQRSSSSRSGSRRASQSPSRARSSSTASARGSRSSGTPKPSRKRTNGRTRSSR
jgi:hemerythrin superfamily protein